MTGRGREDMRKVRPTLFSSFCELTFPLGASTYPSFDAVDFLAPRQLHSISLMPAAHLPLQSMFNSRAYILVPQRTRDRIADSLGRRSLSHAAQYPIAVPSRSASAVNEYILDHDNSGWQSYCVCIRECLLTIASCWTAVSFAVRRVCFSCRN